MSVESKSNPQNQLRQGQKQRAAGPTLTTRGLKALIAALVLSLLLGLPAAAHSVSYTLRESGTLECYPSSSTAKTIIDAKAHHRHKVGATSAYVHNPDDGNWYTSTVSWSGITVAGYSLYNQSGKSYNYTNSYAYCT